MNPPLVVLFIGSDSGVYEGLRLGLSHHRVTSLVAGWFGEARRLASHSAPDVVIVGDEPIGAGLDGFMALVHEEWPAAQVILLGSSPTRGPFGVGIGFLHSARKPISPNLLLRILDSAFPGRLEDVPGCLDERPLVLCVDDDRFFLKFLCRILNRHGYRTAAFNRPLEALDAFPRIGPKLAIVDIEMSEMDGLAFTREVSATSHGNVPVVLLTGKQSASDILDGYGSGASYSISKPCSPGRVLRIVDYLAGELEDSEREVLEARL